MSTIKLSDYGVSYEQAKLDNGVSVHHFRRKGMPICITIKFLAGSVFEKINGTAHFLEHMLVAGTKNYPSKDLLAKRIEREGGGFSASTGNYLINLNASVAQEEDLPIALEVLNEIIFHPSFENTVIETERGSIISEINMYDNDPNSITYRLLDGITFPSTPLGWDIVGSKQSVAAITKQGLLDFKKERLTAANMSITLSGDFDLKKELLRLNEYLGLLPAQSHFDYRKDIQRFQIQKGGTAISTPFRNNEQSNFVLAFATAPIYQNEREEAALVLLSDIIGGGRASRLSKELRYKRGLVYSVNTFYSSQINNSLFGIQGAFETSKLKEIVSIIFEEIKKIKIHSISEEELGHEKISTIKSTFFSAQHAWFWVRNHANDFHYNPDYPSTYDDYLNLLDSITLEEVNEVAKKYLTEKNAYISICGIEETPKFNFDF